MCSSDLQGAALEYMLMYEENLQSEGEAGTEEEEKHRDDIALWATSCSYDSYKLVPCWAFYLDLTTYREEIVAYVNAETGTVNFICNQ